MGLIVNVLKTQGEPEARILVKANGLDAGGPFEPDEEMPAVLIAAGPMGTTVVYDAEYVDGPDGAGDWVRKIEKGNGPMANGRFIWTSDSRFPAPLPLRYFDRWEA